MSMNKVQHIAILILTVSVGIIFPVGLGATEPLAEGVQIDASDFSLSMGEHARISVETRDSPVGLVYAALRLEVEANAPRFSSAASSFGRSL